MNTAAVAGSPKPRHKTKKMLANRGKILLAALALLVVAALGWFWMAQSSSGITVTSSDYKVLKTQKYSNKVAVTGAVAPGKTATLFTHLKGPVSKVDVKIGDRVNAEQLIAQIDVSDVERELNRQMAEQASTEAGNLNQVEQARTQLNQYQEAINKGLNPEINSAQAALRTAEDQYNEAVKTFENKQADKDLGRDPLIRDQGMAVENARSQVLTAAINTVRAGLGIAQILGGNPSGSSPGNGGNPGGNTPGGGAGDTGGTGTGNTAVGGTGNPGGGDTPGTGGQGSPGSGGLGTGSSSLLNGADALNQLNNANQNLALQERTYIDNLAKIDQDLAAAQRAIGGAFESKKEAATALESTILASDHKVQSYEQAVNHAVRAAEAGHVVTEQSANQLRYDISSSEIRAPFNGVVTKIMTEEGQPANGAVLAVGDDSTLLIRTEVKEVDVSKITPGKPVIFTTLATGNKKFSGRVTSVSPVGTNEAEQAAPTAGSNGAGGGGGSATSSSKKATFPVEIEVVGDRDGLLIGGSAKLQIITDEIPNVITVPRDAIFSTDDGAKAVLVAAEKNGSRIIEERKIKIKTSNDVEAVIDNGSLKANDIIITKPENYRNMVGSPIVVDETSSSSESSTTEKGE
ncbi:HlyD family efflux transporter periplasmic adaptor subunit [Corynebacterium freiburgense]|uniref:HlyD family efflux transporter periplasmic adaptor subunit n=1 Tax=Corynebacterium freiburgense TaxID=556548 RepID=UPI0003FCCB35|nr:HlyD family efflux transporter periplasmic adaptor subunit [Corynebacterium freiburgense]WJZ02284.1 Macrolide export protein MacA [Corynebacterium freiburgense]